MKYTVIVSYPLKLTPPGEKYPALIRHAVLLLNPGAAEVGESEMGDSTPGGRDHATGLLYVRTPIRLEDGASAMNFLSRIADLAGDYNVESECENGFIAMLKEGRTLVDVTVLVDGVYRGKMTLTGSLPIRLASG